MPRSSERLPRALGRALDTALDRSVVAGYTRIGYQVRRRIGTWPADPAPNALRGKDVVVTGASSGLGAATAIEMARLGAHVHLVVRDPAKAADVAEQVDAAAGTGAQQVWRCDLADRTSVQRFAADFLRHPRPLAGIVHNAGVLPATRQEDDHGRELTMAVHVLGPIALTEALLPVLAGHRARVVFVTSGGMYTQPLVLDDLDYRRGPYRGPVAYARSKRAQVEMLPMLQRRWGASGIGVYATHPGWAATPGVTSSLPHFASITRPLLRRGNEGIDTTTWLMATEPAPAGGGLWHDRRQRPTTYFGRNGADMQERGRLWDWVRTELGLGPGPAATGSGPSPRTSLEG